MKELDISILFRAVSIVAIVMHHLELISVTGGALFLLFLAGYNFVVFTLPKAKKLHSEDSPTLKAFLRYSWRLYLPVAAYLAALFILLRRFYIHSILMISNFQEPTYSDGIRYWFIEVLIQIILITGIFLSFSQTARSYMFDKPYNFFLVATGVCFFMRLITWNLSVSTGLLEVFPHQLPNVIAFVFFLGGLVASSQETRQRLFSSLFIAFVLLVPIMLGQARRDFIILLISSLLLVWFKEIKVFAFMKFPIFQVAFASLFIYLTHFQVVSTFENFTMSIVTKYAALAVSIALGIVGKILWTAVIKMLSRNSVSRKIIWA